MVKKQRAGKRLILYISGFLYYVHKKLRFVCEISWLNKTYESATIYGKVLRLKVEDAVETAEK